MTYLLVLGISGAAGAFVPAGGVVSAGFSQPVSAAPNTIPNITIRVYIRFIVSVPFTKSAGSTSTIFLKMNG
jgi:hypothetical protein